MSYTYSKANDGEYGLITAGEYEVVIESIKTTTIPTTGTEKIAITYRIRDDIEGQKFGNRLLFEDIWKEKTDKRFYNRKRLNQLLGTQKDVKDGQSFDDIEDLLDVLRGGYLVIVVKEEFDNYYEKDINTIHYYKSSKALPKTLENPIVIEDDDLPF